MKDSDYLSVWIYLLLKATHAEYPVLFKGEKIVLQQGQLITGRKSIANELSINESKVTRILNSFVNEQQIEQQTSNKNRLITVVNWESYQIDEQQNKTLSNNKQTTIELQLNTNKNGKECSKKEKKHIYGTFKKVRLTDSEKSRLIEEFGETFFEDCVKELDEYKEQTGKVYRNDNLAIRKWVVGAVMRKGGKGNVGSKTGQRSDYEQVGF